MIVNELLKRISNLEFEVERYERIIEEMKRRLYNVIINNKDKNDEVSLTMVAYANYLYNTIKEIEENGKSHNL